MEYKVYEKDEHMTSDEVATLLVNLYADYAHLNGNTCDDYAKAVGIAIRMLVD